MQSNRGGAISLIAGAILTMILFAFHPSHVMTAPVLGPFTLSQLVHGMAFVAAPLLAYGMWQMAAWLGGSAPAVRLGLVCAVFAMIMTATAAVISNFVTPTAAHSTMAAMHSPVADSAPGHARRARPMTIEDMPPLIQTSVSMNRGLAQVHVSYLSLAILLFAWAMRRRFTLLAAAGAVVGTYPLLWQLSGRFSPETTTMPWIAFPQSLWLVAVAVAMLRSDVTQES